MPAIKLAAPVLVGDAQRLDRRDQGIDGKFGQQQEAVADRFGFACGRGNGGNHRHASGLGIAIASLGQSRLAEIVKFGQGIVNAVQ